MVLDVQEMPNNVWRGQKGWEMKGKKPDFSFSEKSVVHYESSFIKDFSDKNKQTNQSLGE